MIVSNNIKSITYKPNTNNFKAVKLHNSLFDVKDNFITAFKPVFIKSPVFPKDVFQNNFSNLEPRKRNFIHKFANLSEHYQLMFDVYQLQFLKNFSVEKLKSLYKSAYMQDSFGMKRFSPSELLSIADLPFEKLRFLKPFMKEKNAIGRFNYSYDSLKTIANFSKDESKKAMMLLGNKILSDDLIALCKDNNANIQELKNRINTLNNLFKDNISEISVKKYQNNYVLSLLTENEHKAHRYVFDNQFKLNKNYKSDVDFEAQKFVNKSFFSRLNPFASKKSVSVVNNTVDNLRVSEEEHFYALDDIQDYAEFVKQMYMKAYKHNFYVIHSGKGHFINTDFKLPENLLVNYWQKGAISQDDLIKICSDNAGVIPESDFKFFAKNKIKMTHYDNDRYLEIRRRNVLSEPVKVGSVYFNQVLQKTLKAEEAKLKNIRAERKLLIIDGLPGAGKSTIIKKILNGDINSYYTPDADDIKGMFEEVYKQGECAELVHKASSHILRNYIIPNLFAQGKNLIFQTSGGSVNIHKIIQQAKSNGYDVDFIHIATPKQLSMQRSISRFEQMGRFIDPYAVLSIFNHNNREKKYAAKIFSYHEGIRNAYRVENGEVFLIKDGQISKMQKL